MKADGTKFRWNVPTGRHFIGMELDEGYFRTAEERLLGDGLG